MIFVPFADEASRNNYFQHEDRVLKKLGMGKYAGQGNTVTSQDDVLSRMAELKQEPSTEVTQEIDLPDTDNNETQSESFNPGATASKNSFFSFEGRIPRSTYWLTIIPLYLIGFTISIVFALLISNGASEDIQWLKVIYIIPAAWIVFAAYAKRWRDLGQSGWLALTLLIPFINILIILYLGFAPGISAQNAANKAERGQDGVENKVSPWMDLIKSSLVVGLILTVLWALIVIVSGALNIGTAEGLSDLLGNGFGILAITSGLTFLMKTALHFSKVNK